MEPIIAQFETNKIENEDTHRHAHRQTEDVDRGKNFVPGDTSTRYDNICAHHIPVKQVQSALMSKNNSRSEKS